MYTKSLIILGTSAIVLAAPQPPRVQDAPSLPKDYQVQTHTFGKAKFLDFKKRQAGRGALEVGEKRRRDIPVSREKRDIPVSREKRDRPVNHEKRSNLRKRAFVCAPTDDDGSAVDASRSNDAAGICIYPSSGQCEYFAGNGTFSAGASNCPGGMVEGTAAPPPSSPSPPPATTPAPPPPATTPPAPSLPPPPATTPTVPIPSPSTLLPPVPTLTPVLPSPSPAPSTPSIPVPSASQTAAGNNNAAMGSRPGPGVLGIMGVLVGAVTFGMF